MTELPTQYAIIRTSGHQFLVKPGQTIQVDKLEGDEKTITFSDVLLVRDGATVKVGQPTVSGASVTGEVVFTGQAKKVVVQKFKSKVRYRNKRGHRQQIARVKITGITA
jgi:large subunit ribosomal protein L21